MPFNSFEFAAFFGCVLVAFYAWPSWAWRKAVIVVSSYIYYGAWYPPYVLLLNDADTAPVLSHIRNAWGNRAAPVSELDVSRQRSSVRP